MELDYFSGFFPSDTMVVRGGFKAFIHVQACQLAARGVDCKEIGIPIGLTEALSYRAIIISVSSLPEFPVIGGIALYGESTEASAFHRMIDKDQLIPYCFHLLLIFVGEATVLVL